MTPRDDDTTTSSKRGAPPPTSARSKPAAVEHVEPMPVGTSGQKIRSVLELLDDDTQAKLGQGFAIEPAGDDSQVHVACKETGKRWILPRPPQNERSEAQLREAARVAGGDLLAHLAQLAESKKKQPS